MSENTRKSTETAPINRSFLRHLRENIAEWTLEELAKEMNVPVKRVRAWETGRIQPNQKEQIALEKLYGLKGGNLAIEMKQLFLDDFSAAYFGDEKARARLEWVDDKRKLAQLLDILPPQAKKRIV